MNRIHLALIPALLLGILTIIFFASFSRSSEVTVAFAQSTHTTSPAGAAATQLTPPVPSAGCQVSSRFPAKVRQWCSWIDQFAGPLHLDSSLIAAVMWLESGGNPTAYSKSGAVGLMQVMPRDGLAASFQCKNGPCFAARPSMDELYDPQFNISYGVRMLAGLLESTGSLREALRRYGPMDVEYTYADRVLKIYESYR